ncbi:YdeI/OmpD-associated family protein [Pikeienuella piscinae]|nr:YdeI/OmpD-associated family protein [Pikeienuella piscinae]
MSKANAKIEAFFANTDAWREELAALRAILLASPLTEDFKWNSPCYTFEGGNVAALWRLKTRCAVAFFKGALMTDSEGRLAPPGANSRAMRMIAFDGVEEIARAEAGLKASIAEAIGVEKAGMRVEFPKDDIAFPDELVELLSRNQELNAAFDALTPGRRRGYLLHFSGARKSATRTSRIEKSAPRIRAGKGMHDR